MPKHAKRPHGPVQEEEDDKNLWAETILRSLELSIQDPEVYLTDTSILCSLKVVCSGNVAQLMHNVENDKPHTFVLLLDRSSSMSGHRNQHLLRMLRAFLELLRKKYDVMLLQKGLSENTRDLVVIYSFDDVCEKVYGPCIASEALEKFEMIEESLVPRGGTSITPAIMKSFDEFRNDNSHFLLLTDGEDEAFNQDVDMALNPHAVDGPVFSAFVDKINHPFMIFAIGEQVDYKNLSRFADRIMKGSFYLLPDPETLPQDLAVIMAKVFETIHNNSTILLGEIRLPWYAA